MKKLSILFLFAIFCFTTTTTFAQETKEVKKEIKEVKKGIKSDKAEIAIADLPEAIQKTLKESFADYNVKKAYKAKEGLMHYVKLEKDGKWLKLAIDTNGKVIKQKELEKNDKQSEQKS